jgi:hypothetical protein
MGVAGIQNTAEPPDIVGINCWNAILSGWHSPPHRSAGGTPQAEGRIRTNEGNHARASIAEIARQRASP